MFCDAPLKKEFLIFALTSGNRKQINLHTNPSKKSHKKTLGSYTHIVIQKQSGPKLTISSLWGPKRPQEFLLRLNIFFFFDPFDHCRSELPDFLSCQGSLSSHDRNTNNEKGQTFASRFSWDIPLQT